MFLRVENVYYTYLQLFAVREPTISNFVKVASVFTVIDQLI